jgi:hypothetical protein
LSALTWATCCRHSICLLYLSRRLGSVSVSRATSYTTAWPTNRQDQTCQEIYVAASSWCIKCYRCDASATTRVYYQKELQDFACNYQIELHDWKELITPGWEGTPKGHLRALGEIELIERASLERYTLEEQKDTITGKVD